MAGRPSERTKFLVAGAAVGATSIVGGYLLAKRRRMHTAKASGRLTDIACRHIISGTNTEPTWHCEATVVYNLVDRPSTLSKRLVIDSDVDYRTRDSVDVYYNPEDPQDVTLHPAPWGAMGWLVAAVGLALMVAAFVRARG